MTLLQQAGPAPTLTDAQTERRQPGSARDRGLLVLTWLVLLALIAGPIVYVVVAAVSANPAELGSGFDFTAVHDVFATGSMLSLLARSVAFALVVGVLSTVLATALAWTTVRLQIWGSRVRETLCLGSLFIAPFVTTVAWVWLATPQTGVINKILISWHLPSWLQPDVLSTYGMIFVLVAHYVPYGYLLVSASMRRIDTRMEEASLLCGRGMGFTALRISLPMLRAALLSSVLFVAILALGEFSVPAILDQAGAFAPLSVTVYTALYGANQNLPLAAAVSTELMIVAMIGLYLYQRTMRRGERFVSVSGRGHADSRVRTSRLTGAIVWVVTLAYGVITFLIPLAAVVLMALSQYLAPSLGGMHLSFANLWSSLDTPEIRTATINTIELAIAVPVVSIVIGIVVVFLADRLRLRTARGLTYLATAPLSVPGLVMGTGLLLLLIRTPLYGSLTLIGIGLIAVSVTHAVRLVSNGVQQIDPSLEEASQVCGVSRFRTVWSVLVPLIRPSVFSAFILIFVLTMRELNVAVTLSTPNTPVLSVVAWNYSSSALTKSAAVGLLQLAIMLVGMGVLRAAFRINRRKA
jgi:iron(III) transport system permease protein